MSEDGSMCAAPQHRYVYSFKLVDFTGETWANIFSAEVRMLTLLRRETNIE
jgi:hypothetical protein